MTNARILCLTMVIGVASLGLKLQACCESSSPFTPADGSALILSASSESVSPTEAEPFSLFDLPIEITHKILPYLDSHSFLSLTATCTHARSLLDDPTVTRRQLIAYGFLLPNHLEDVTPVSAAIFMTLPLLELWRSGNYLELLRRRSEFAAALYRCAEEETHLHHKEILLRQAVLWGHTASILPWGSVLHTYSPETILDILTDVYSRSGVWVPNASVDEILYYIVYTLPDGRRLLRTSVYAPALKRLCCLGSFEIIAWIQTLIRNGTDGFERNVDLANDILCMLSQGRLETAWQIVIHKKSRKPRKITLQDLLPRIMSAIDAREDE